MISVKFIYDGIPRQFMFPFKRHLPSAQEKTIKDMCQLIEWLEENKKSWKRYRPTIDMDGTKLTYDIGDRYKHSVIDMSTDAITREFNNLIKHVRKACLTLCSVYISLLKRACRAAKNTDNRKTEKDLHEIYAVMASLFDNMLVSDLKKELKKEHRIEFMQALKLKKYVKENYKREMMWDVEWMYEHGVPEWDETDPDWIKVRQKVAKRMHDTAGKNWRENSIVKKVLKKEQQFTNDIGELLKRFKAIIDNFIR